MGESTPKDMSSSRSVTEEESKNQIKIEFQMYFNFNHRNIVAKGKSILLLQCLFIVADVCDFSFNSHIHFIIHTNIFEGH